MKKIEEHIKNTYPQAYWHICFHIEVDGWLVMLDSDDGKIRIGVYELDANREQVDEVEPSIWVEIPEDFSENYPHEDIAISTLDGIISSLPAPVASHT